MTEQQMLDKQSAMQANFDGKKFICGPWLGDRGGAFELIFRPYFETALMKIVNISTLYQHICDETAVGSANGPAHPAGAGLVAQGWLSQQAARARDDTGYAYILSHVGHTQDAEDRIKAHKLEVLTGAPTAAAVTAQLRLRGDMDPLHQILQVRKLLHIRELLLQDDADVPGEVLRDLEAAGADGVIRHVAVLIHPEVVAGHAKVLDDRRHLAQQVLRSWVRIRHCHVLGEHRHLGHVLAGSREGAGPGTTGGVRAPEHAWRAGSSDQNTWRVPNLVKHV